MKNLQTAPNLLINSSIICRGLICPSVWVMVTESLLGKFRRPWSGCRGYLEAWLWKKNKRYNEVYAHVFNGTQSWSRNAMHNIMFMNYVMWDYTNSALHQSMGRRAGSESDEQSLLTLHSSLQSIHPTDITKQSITSTISPPFSQNSSSSILTK